jgi:hypothetical protein
MIPDNGLAAVSRSYGTGLRDESATSVASGGGEVWLRGNLRPVAAGAALACLVGAVLIALAWWSGGAVRAGWAALATAVVILPAGAAFARAAARPRLRRCGACLEVRLSPLALQRVPLEVVECVFPGSRPLPPGAGGDASPDRRVTTLIIRLAERATDWRARPTFVPWGTWEDGHIVIDGRWSEPLSLERTRALAARLLEARQAAAGDCGAATGS